MLSKEDNRRIAQLERQLLREDPEFCARMQPGRPPRKRAPLSLVLTAAVVWAAALVLGIVGWWIAAAIAAGWAVVIVAALAIRCRPGRRHESGPDFLPPIW
jgi:fatty acid desaturase